MPIENVFIARVNDGLILVASMENTTSSDRLEVYRNQAKQIIKKLSPRSASKLSVESDSYVFHYIIENGICYLILTDRGYPKRLGFLFLEDIAREFQADIREEHGDDWLRAVETAGRQYEFIRFDRVIQRKRREYSDPNSSANMKKLNDDLQNIQSVMRKTIDDVLDRGNKLEDVSNMSKNLASESKKYKWGAKKLSAVALMKQWAPLIVLVGVALIIIVIRFML